MLTVRTIEKTYAAGDFNRLLHDLTSHRADAVIRWDARSNKALLAAAMGVIRLDELAQSYRPLATKLLKAVLSAQDSDGGWGDPLSTALCLRALLASGGDGAAVERAFGYLATVQRDEGAFPAGPFRRLPADPHVTAAVVYLLGDQPAFWDRSVALPALEWLEANPSSLDVASKVLARHASLRCRRSRPPVPPTPMRRYSQVA